MNVDNQETNASQPLTLTRRQTATQRRRRQRLNQKRRVAQLRCENIAPNTTSVNALEESAALSDAERAVKKSMRRKQRRNQLKRAKAPYAGAAKTLRCGAGSEEQLLHMTNGSITPISTSTSSSLSPSSLSSSMHNCDILFNDFDYLQNPLALKFSALLPIPMPSEGKNHQSMYLPNAGCSVQSWSDQTDQMEMKWSAEVSSTQTNHWNAQGKHVAQSQKWHWASSAKQQQCVHSNPYNTNLTPARPPDQESNYSERRAYYIERNTYTQRVFKNRSGSISSVAQQPLQQRQQVYQRKRRYEEYYPEQA